MEKYIRNTDFFGINEEPQGTPHRIWRWCFTYDFWKDEVLFSGQWWYSTLESFDGLMNARNTRPSQSLECMKNLRQFHVHLQRIIFD